MVVGYEYASAVDVGEKEREGEGEGRRDRQTDRQRDRETQALGAHRSTLQLVEVRPLRIASSCTTSFGRS